MTADLKEMYLKTIFQFKNLINTEFGRGKRHVLSLTDLLILQGIADGQSSAEIAVDLRITKGPYLNAQPPLLKKELITRTIDETNRRNLTLALTEAGRARLAATSSEFDVAFGTFVKQMGAEDLKQLLKLMNQMSMIIGKD